MKIAIVGDLHGNLPEAEVISRLLSDNGITEIYQVGDFGFVWPNSAEKLESLNDTLVNRGQKIYWVDGNHEDFGQLYDYPINDVGRRIIRSNIIHLPRGLRFNLGNVSFLALGGATSVDKKSRTSGVSWWQEEALSLGDAYRAAAAGPADVMLTHDCPDGVDIPGIGDGRSMDAEGVRFWGYEAIEASNAHRTMLGDVVEVVQPHILFHGHFHRGYKGIRKNMSGSNTTIFGLANDGEQFKSIIKLLDLDTLEVLDVTL